MLMPGRNYNSAEYRWGFNGKENDNEVKGAGNSLDFGARIYDSRLGKWLSVDALTGLAVDWTPYRFGFNNPILFMDKDGNIEWPLNGFKAIDKHTKVYDFHDVYNKSKKVWECQTGYFEGELTKEYKDWMKSPSPQTIVRTSWWSALRQSTEKKQMTSPHVGTDFKAAKGTPFYSLGDGIIEELDEKKGIMTVKYGSDKVTFRHLDCIEESFEVGKKVYEGQILGNTGNTNSSGGPHLHVEAKNKNGKNIDPEKKNYGTVTNKQFFTDYGGDYRRLKGYLEDHKPENTNPRIGPVPSPDN
jgi:RHS repeat-associated protein